jgi:hypothetical protein
MSISGKYLSAAIGMTNIEGTHEWSFDEKGDRLEATVGSTNGRGRKDVGVIDSNIRIVFYLDITSGEYAFIRAGTTLSNLALFHDMNADDPMFLIATAKVFDSRVRGQVRERMIVEAEIEPYGDVITVVDPADSNTP